MAHYKLADYVIIIILGDVTDKRFRLQATPLIGAPNYSMITVLWHDFCSRM